MKRICYIIALLSCLAAVGFFIAYFISKYTPYILLATMWILIGTLNVFISILQNKREATRI